MGQAHACMHQQLPWGFWVVIWAVGFYGHGCIRAACNTRHSMTAAVVALRQLVLVLCVRPADGLGVAAQLLVVGRSKAGCQQADHPAMLGHTAVGCAVFVLQFSSSRGLQLSSGVKGCSLGCRNVMACLCCVMYWVLWLASSQVHGGACIWKKASHVMQQCHSRVAVTVQLATAILPIVAVFCRQHGGCACP
jgi:hypothetical protein